MLKYLSLDIICSSKLTVFLELRSRKTVRFSEEIKSADKYPSIFSRQMATIVYIFLSNFPSSKGAGLQYKKDGAFYWYLLQVKEIRPHPQSRLGIFFKIGEYINNSRHLARKYARIFVRGHYLFREAERFPYNPIHLLCMQSH